MKRLQVTDQELIDRLRRMAPETGSLICLGCGWERNCSIHGCAVLRTAVDRLKELTAPHPNPLLTLEELREMDGEAVYLKDGHCYIVYKNFQIPSKHFEPSGVDREGHQMPLDVLAIFGVYRRKPEKETI